MVEPFEVMMRRGGAPALMQASLFFSDDDSLVTSLRQLDAAFAKLRIPYVVAGGIAMLAHGYSTAATPTIEVVIDSPDAQYTDRMPQLPKPFRVKIHNSHGGRVSARRTLPFPDPAIHAIEIDGVRFLELTALVEMELSAALASGPLVTHTANVLEIIQVLALPADLAEKLHPVVRDKYAELWQTVAATPKDE